MNQPSNGSRAWVVAAVGLGSLIGAIDGSVANTVLPVIAVDFKAGIQVIEWVLLAYLLVLSSALLTVGKWGDLAGHRRMFLAGFVVFGVASMVCGAAPNELVLIIFRGLQGGGAAMLSASGIVMVTRVFGRRERGKGIGLIVGIIYFGLAVGPAVGGFLAAAMSWRAVFYINLPIAVVGLLLGARVLPRDAPAERQPRFDLVGAALSAVALAALLVGLSQGEMWGWTSLLTVAMFAVAVAGSAAFVVVEVRHPQPVLDLRLFRNRLFGAAVGSATIFYAGAFFSYLQLPFYLLQARHFSLSQAGLLLVVSPSVMMILAPLAGRLSDRIGSRVLSTAGLLLSAAGSVLLALLGPASGIHDIVLAGIVMGAGNGMFSTPNTSTIMGAVPPAHHGTASGTQAVARNVGMVVGIALAGTIYSARLAALGGPSAFYTAYRDTLFVAAALLLSGSVLSAVRGAGQPDSTTQELDRTLPEGAPVR